MAFIRTAKKIGAVAVVMTTDAYKNDQVNAFYQKMGFSLLKTFEAQPGRRLKEYILNLGAEKVE